MPMIRRFSKVSIVGELSVEDRVKLLKHFADFLPHNIEDEFWMGMSEKLAGATGDIIRKVIDSVWRDAMTEFVSTNPTRARELVDWLNEDTKFDVASFDRERRKNFKKKLSHNLIIEPEHIEKSVDEALSNVAILTEIETAQETYENARELLNEITEERALA